MSNKECVDIPLSRNYTLRIIKYKGESKTIELGIVESIYSGDIGYRMKLAMKYGVARELGKVLLKLTSE